MKISQEVVKLINKLNDINVYWRPVSSFDKQKDLGRIHSIAKYNRLNSSLYKHIRLRKSLVRIHVTKSSSSFCLICKPLDDHQGICRTILFSNSIAGFWISHIICHWRYAYRSVPFANWVSYCDEISERRPSACSTAASV